MRHHSCMDAPQSEESIVSQHSNTEIIWEHFVVLIGFVKGVLITCPLLRIILL